MYLKILNLPFRGLSAESKYVLVAMARYLGHVDLKPLSRDEIADFLGISKRVVSKALVHLISLEMLSKAIEVSAGVRRTGYQIHPDLISNLAQVDESSLPTSIHESLVGCAIGRRCIQTIGPDHECAEATTESSLASWSDTDKRVLVRSGNLSVSNRLLLAILLSHADNFGWVDNLGRTRLSWLTGLDITSLKQRLCKLIDLGFIRRYVPGVASPVFQNKLTGTYILNLNHRQLTCGQDFSSLLIHASHYRTDIRYAYGVYGDVSAVRGNKRWESYQTPASVLKFLWKGSVSVFEQIELLLCRYASELLSGSQYPLMHYKQYESEAIRAKIRNDFQMPEANDEKAILHQTEILDFFYSQACALAYECRQRFGQATELSSKKMELMLIPPSWQEGHQVLALLVRLGDAIAKPRSHQIDEAGDVQEVRPHSNEAEIDPEVRYACGLLTAPKLESERKSAAKAKAQAKYRAKIAKQRAAKLQGASK